MSALAGRAGFTAPRPPTGSPSAESGRGATTTQARIRPDTHVHCFLAADARIRERDAERIRHLEDELDRRANVISDLSDQLAEARCIALDVMSRRLLAVTEPTQ